MAYLPKLLHHLKLKGRSCGRGYIITLLHQVRNINTLGKKRIKINDIMNDTAKRIIRITWSNHMVTEFPHVFLRDNCQCPSCFHSSSKQRLVDLVKFIDVDIKAKYVNHDISKDAIIIKWPDNHESIFQGGWLKERRFPESWEDAHSSTLYDIRPQPWTSSYMEQNLPLIDYKELMSSDEALQEHLQNLFIHGLSVIKEAPTESGILYELAGRVSYNYLKRTHYGEIFTVKNKPSPNNLAYTAGDLPLHVDLPFFSYQPEVQHLHCIEQSSGEHCGISLLADGFRAAEEVKNKNLSFFNILTKIMFKFNDVGTDIYGKYNFEFERPIIGLDSFGNVATISYNNQVRSSFINVPSEVVRDCYKAYYELTTSLNSDILHYKMSPGDILTFNNKRVLHGRTSFDPRMTSRWLEGCYMDWDEVCSKYRVVRELLSHRL